MSQLLSDRAPHPKSADPTSHTEHVHLCMRVPAGLTAKLLLPLCSRNEPLYDIT